MAEKPSKLTPEQVQEIYEALPEDVKVGLAEDLVDLTERRMQRQGKDGEK